MSEKILSERAKLRLKLAAGFLRSGGQKFECPREQFYQTIQSALSELSLERQAQLKALVDWMEEYERARAIHVPQSTKRS